jgi:UDP:flavonoid glycosyltransferase YjiC (YdhE family)
VRRRALVRRSVRADRSSEPVLQDHLADYHLAVVPDDPTEHRSETLPIPAVRVPPVTIFEVADAVGREEARARLGLPSEGRLVLVASGGGGDPRAREIAARAAEVIAGLPGGPTPVLAEGPLERAEGPLAKHVLAVRRAPIQPLLGAFDGAIAPAGYNLAHELAGAGVPAALFAQDRPFDDQAARAARFERAGLALALRATTEAAIADAVRWMEQAPRPSLEAGGADRAADALLRLVTGDGGP